MPRRSTIHVRWSAGELGNQAVKMVAVCVGDENLPEHRFGCYFYQPCNTCGIQSVEMSVEQQQRFHFRGACQEFILGKAQGYHICLALILRCCTPSRACRSVAGRCRRDGGLRRCGLHLVATPGFHVEQDREESDRRPGGCVMAWLDFAVGGYPGIECREISVSSATRVWRARVM